MYLRMIAIVLMLSYPVLALPDFEILDVSYIADDERIVAVITNNGNETSVGLVYFFLGDRKIGENSREIEGGDTAAVYIVHRLEDGKHTLLAEVDPLNNIEEENDDNNRRQVVMDIGNAQEKVVPFTREQLIRLDDEESIRAMGMYIGGIIIIASVFAFFFTKVHMFPGGHKTENKKFLGNVKSKLAESTDTYLSQKKIKPFPKIKMEKKAEQTAEDSITKIKDVIGMSKGTSVTVGAGLSFYDKIGDNFVYFLRDNTEEILGFSKTAIEKREGVISGKVDAFMDEHTSIMIESVR